MKRCDWAESNEKMQRYHDDIWGKPEYSDQQLFRKLILELNQAGLSWQTILNKMACFDEAYEHFDIEKVANFSEEKLEELMQNPGVIRHRKKIEAAIVNAQKVLEIQASGISFANFLWEYVDFQPINHQCQRMSEVPATNQVSEQLAKDLKKMGFKFVGSTTIYAFMQAVGMINDHLVTCPCYQKVKEKANA